MVYGCVERIVLWITLHVVCGNINVVRNGHIQYPEFQIAFIGVRVLFLILIQLPIMCLADPAKSVIHTNVFKRKLYTVTEGRLGQCTLATI